MHIFVFAPLNFENLQIPSARNSPKSSTDKKSIKNSLYDYSRTSKVQAMFVSRASRTNHDLVWIIIYTWLMENKRKRND